MLKIDKLNWFFIYIINFISFGYVFDFFLGVYIHGDNPFGSGLYHGFFHGVILSFLNLIIFNEKLDRIEDAVRKKRMWILYMASVTLSLVSSIYFNVN